jgi:hypothetical protein
MCLIDGQIVPVDINYALILDRMYKKKLKDGDLDNFTAAQVDDMKATCLLRAEVIAKRHKMANEISF